MSAYPRARAIALCKKLSGKEAQRIQFALERVGEADDQFLNSCGLKSCQTLADRIWAADQHALFHVAKAAQQRGRPCLLCAQIRHSAAQSSRGAENAQPAGTSPPLRTSSPTSPCCWHGKRLIRCVPSG